MAESQKSAAAVNPRPDPNEKLVKVFDTEQESEALVVKGLLESSGIDSEITSLSAPQDTFPGVGGTIILVREEDAEAAKRIIAEFQQSPDATDGDSADDDASDEEAMADSTGESPQKG
jgi:Putative prokaryotic signal transducing protein